MHPGSMVSDNPTLNFSLMTGDQLRLVNRFYRANGHKGKSSREDQVYIAKTDLSIVAAVRFTRKDNEWLLRGLWVAADLRQQGIGGQLLQYCLPFFQQPIWCYPYDHLVGFYRRHGFQVSASEQAPASIATPWQAYQNKGETFALMMWAPDQ